MDTAKAMDLTCLCLQINNTVGFFFQSYTHRTYKEIQSRNHVHSKPKVHQVIFRVSQYRTKDIHCRTEQLSQFKREKEREKERDRKTDREKDSLR